MFTIIGGDGKEYGPVTTDQVRNWIATGRANLETKARAATSEEWRRLADFAEFGGVSGMPPTLPIAGVIVDPAVPALVLPLAGLGERFGAALIDGILEALCWTPTSILITQAVRDQIASGTPNIGEMMAAMNGSVTKSLPYLGVLVVVQCTLLSLRGQSLGKALLGLRIVRHRTGAPARFLHAFFLRGFVPWVLCQIPLLGKLFWLVDGCFILGEERRCVHDYIGGTSVVKSKT